MYKYIRTINVVYYLQYIVLFFLLTNAFIIWAVAYIPQRPDAFLLVALGAILDVGHIIKSWIKFTRSTITRTQLRGKCPEPYQLANFSASN